MKTELFNAYQRESKAGTWKIAGIAIPVSIKDEPGCNAPFTLIEREFQRNKQGNNTLRKYHAKDINGKDRIFAVETWRVEMIKELPAKLKKEIKAAS